MKKTATFLLASLVVLAITGFLFTDKKDIYFIHADSSENITGWAWSGDENTGDGGKGIGWVSFNSSDCDTNNDGKSEGAGSCPVAGTTIPDYGVNIEPSGNFSGYAWSDTIGWINFAPTSDYPGAPNYSVKVDSSTGEVSGWARACSAYASGCSGAEKSAVGTEMGDWDGWIKLRQDSGDGGSSYGVNINKSTGDFSGYAWGSDIVVGWLDFSKVKTSFGFGPVNSPLIVEAGNYPDVYEGSDKFFFDGARVVANPENLSLIYQWTCDKYQATSLGNANQLIADFTPPADVSGDQEVQCMLKATDVNDPLKLASDVTNKFKVLDADGNNNPEIDSFYMPPSVNEGETVAFSFSATDADSGDTLKYKWTCNLLNAGSSLDNSSGYSVDNIIGVTTSNYKAAYIVTPVYDQCTLTVTDSKGGKVSKTQNILINTIINLSCGDGVKGSGEYCDEPGTSTCLDGYSCDNCQCVDNRLF